MSPSPRLWRRTAGALVVGATVVLAACGPGGGGGTTPGVSLLSDYKAEKGTKGGKLTYSDWQKVDNLNGFASSSAAISQATILLWSYTWTFDPKGKAVPDLVKEIPTTENGDIKKVDDKHMDVTLNLKPGLMWSDGQPLTSDDLKFTLNTICDPTASFGGGTTGFDHIASIDVKSTTQLVMHFGPELTMSGKDAEGKAAYRCGLPDKLDSGIYAPIVGSLNFQVMPKHALQNNPPSTWTTIPYFTTKPTVTSGPFMVRDFQPGPSAVVVLVPNPHYHDGRAGGDFFADGPYLDQLTYKIYGSTQAMIAGLQAGETDIGLNLTVSDVPALSNITTRKTAVVTGLLSEWLTFNEGNNTKGCQAQQFAATCGTPTLFGSDRQLREALAKSIDKTAVNQIRNKGQGGVMNTLFFPGFGTTWYDTAKENYKPDVAGANSELDADGWVKGSDGIRAKGGKKLAFTITTTGGNAARVAMEQQIISDWKAVGADVTQANCSTNCFGDFPSAGDFATGQYDISLFANNWSPDPDIMCAYMLGNQIPSATTPSGNNWGRIKNSVYDKTCADEQGTLDTTARVAAFKRMQDEMLKDWSFIGLEVRPDVNAYAPYAGNFAINPTSALSSWNTADWYRKGTS
jgi:peptide/nickel transport system substrate-binding protein